MFGLFLQTSCFLNTWLNSSFQSHSLSKFIILHCFLSGPGTAHGLHLHIITEKHELYHTKLLKIVFFLGGKDVHGRCDAVTQCPCCDQVSTTGEILRWTHKTKQQHKQRTATYHNAVNTKQPRAVWLAFVWLFTLRTPAAKMKNTLQNTHDRYHYPWWEHSSLHVYGFKSQVTCLNVEGFRSRFTKPSCSSLYCATMLLLYVFVFII